MKKVFIAGAVCPECKQQDKIFVYHKDGDDIAQCNACGHQSIRPKDNQVDKAQEIDGFVKLVPNKS